MNIVDLDRWKSGILLLLRNATKAFQSHEPWEGLKLLNTAQAETKAYLKARQRILYEKMTRTIIDSDSGA